jgi:uncharacterized alkaline shock family protein YloU
MPPPEPPNSGTEDQSSLGEIKVSHSVIAGIVRLAALQVKGVGGVGGGLLDGMAEFFSKGESDRGVKIDEDETGTYAIEVRLVITYGAEIGRTAFDVQLAVRNQVANMTGKNVRRVDVIIDGVKLPPSAQPTSDARESDWPHIPHATD